VRGSHEDQAAPLARAWAHRLLLLIALLCPLLMGAVAYSLEPDPRGYGTHEQLGLAACASMRHLNLPCPGCGVTTAVTLAYRGRLASSLGTQPFGFLLAVSALVAAPWALAVHLRGRDLTVLLGGGAAVALVKLAGAALALGWVYTLVRGLLGGG